MDLFWLGAGSDYTKTINSSAWASASVQYASQVGSGTNHSLTAHLATWFITGVQLEVGQNPTSFEHEPFERTLTKCLRFIRLSNDGSESFQPVGNGIGHAESTTSLTTGWMSNRNESQPTLAVFEEETALGVFC